MGWTVLKWDTWWLDLVEWRQSCFFWMFLVHDSTKNKMNFRHRAGQVPVEFTAKKQITKQPWKSTLQGQCALLDAVAECAQALLYGRYTNHAWCNGCLCSVCTYSLHWAEAVWICVPLLLGADLVSKDEVMAQGIIHHIVAHCGLVLITNACFFGKNERRVACRPAWRSWIHVFARTSEGKSRTVSG